MFNIRSFVPLNWIGKVGVNQNNYSMGNLSSPPWDDEAHSYCCIFHQSVPPHESNSGTHKNLHAKVPPPMWCGTLTTSTTCCHEWRWRDGPCSWIWGNVNTLLTCSCHISVGGSYEHPQFFHWEVTGVYLSWGWADWGAEFTYGCWYFSNCCSVVIPLKK